MEDVVADADDVSNSRDACHVQKVWRKRRPERGYNRLQLQPHVSGRDRDRDRWMDGERNKETDNELAILRKREIEK